MGVKEQLVEIVRGEGYDFMTACELVTDCIKEFKASGKREARYYIGRTSFTIRNEAVK
jgi:hypothetical protein